MESREEKKILIADEDIAVHRALGEYFKREGFEVFNVYDGFHAVVSVRELCPDIVILDVELGEKKGLYTCREIRRESNVPIIILTEKDGESDRLMGFEMGADDYIAKPFSPHEVMARVKAILRRINSVQQGKEKTCAKADNLEVDIEAFVVRLNGKVVSCTPKEIEILWLLVNNPGIVFSREHLLQRIWGYDYLGDTRAVDSHIKRIRAKLCRQSNKWEINTVWGVGYRFERIENIL